MKQALPGIANSLATVLIARGPCPEIPADRDLFGPFVGEWDLDVEWLENGQVLRREKGEWTFDWTLGGRAIQDVWVVPSEAGRSGSRGSYEFGTSVRFYDEQEGDWHSIWIGPVQKSVRHFRAQRRGDEIILDGRESDGTPIRWIFSDIGKNEFKWRFERHLREEWIVVQRFFCARRSLQT